MLPRSLHPEGWQTRAVTVADDSARKALLRRSFALEYATLGGTWWKSWSWPSRPSPPGWWRWPDSAWTPLIEIGASTVVAWELSGTGRQRQRRALRLIGYAFAALAIYLLVQSTLVLATGYHPRHSALGITWTAITAAVMFALARQDDIKRPEPPAAGWHRGAVPARRRTEVSGIGAKWEYRSMVSRGQKRQMT